MYCKCACHGVKKWKLNSNSWRKWRSKLHGIMMHVFSWLPYPEGAFWACPRHSHEWTCTPTHARFVLSLTLTEDRVHFLLCCWCTARVADIGVSGKQSGTEYGKTATYNWHMSEICFPLFHKVMQVSSCLYVKQMTRTKLHWKTCSWLNMSDPEMVKISVPRD